MHLFVVYICQLYGAEAVVQRKPYIHCCRDLHIINKCARISESDIFTENDFGEDQMYITLPLTIRETIFQLPPPPF